MSSLAELLGRSDEDQPCPMPHDIQIVCLQEAAKSYVNPPTFSVGQIVTPRQNTTLRGVGQPHIVIDVNRSAVPNFVAGDPGNMSYGRRYDLRVARLAPDGEFIAHWCEAAEFEPYHAEVAQVPDQAAADQHAA